MKQAQSTDTNDTARGNENASTHQAGLVANASQFARNLFALFVTRLELAALELGEARDHVARLVVVGALGLICIFFALAGWTAVAVALAWESMGWKILLIVAGVYTVLAFILLLSARSMVAAEKLKMPATLAELKKDREALF